MRPHPSGERPLPAEAIEKETTSSGFAELLTIPEDSSLPVDKREKLQIAANKIAELIYLPLRAGENTLSKEDISDAIRKLYEDPVKQARETLELFESVIRDLRGEGENAVSSVILAVKQKSETETVFLITPNTKSPDYEKGQNLGQIGKRNVRKVEVVIKTAESDEGKEYTQQTIKVIALNKKGEQIENIRIEVHSTEKRKSKPQRVQVDADIGGERLAQTHLNVDSLGQGKEALNNFRLLQYAFLVNFAEKVATVEPSSLDFGNEDNQQLFAKVVYQAKQNLGLPVEAERTTKEARVESKKVTLEELQQAASNIPPVLVTYLREPLAKIWETPQDGISDADIALCYLFEMGPHQITQKKITALNGRATKAVAALVNFSTLEEVTPEEALEQISDDPILVQAGQKIMDEVPEPEALIVQLGKLATVQKLIKETG